MLVVTAVPDGFFALRPAHADRAGWHVRRHAMVLDDMPVMPDGLSIMSDDMPVVPDGFCPF